MLAIYHICTHRALDVKLIYSKCSAFIVIENHSSSCGREEGAELPGNSSQYQQPTPLPSPPEPKHPPRLTRLCSCWAYWVKSAWCWHRDLPRKRFSYLHVSVDMTWRARLSPCLHIPEQTKMTFKRPLYLTRIKPPGVHAWHQGTRRYSRMLCTPWSNPSWRKVRVKVFMLCAVYRNSSWFSPPGKNLSFLQGLRELRKEQASYFSCFVLLGFFFFLSSRRPQRAFWAAGLLFGLAIAVSQPTRSCCG